MRERNQESNEKGAGKSAVNQMKNLDTREPKISAMYFKTEYAREPKGIGNKLLRGLKNSCIINITGIGTECKVLMSLKLRYS